MINLNKLAPRELRAAMQQGYTAGWGRIGSATENVRYSMPVPKQPGRRRKCYCGCGMPITHMGMANGLALTSACELGIARWVRTGSARPAPAGQGVNHGHE